MVCYYCGSGTGVINSRLQKRANRVWRRRKCLRCGNVVTTTEQLDYASSLSFKPSTGRLEPFQRDILFVAVLDSLRYRKTAVTDATQLTDTILSRLASCFDETGAVDRQKLVGLCHSVLARFDHPAGVQYAAYHPV